jgi:hypothetical protein
LLVVGRDRDMDAGERLRFEWWREHVVVRSRRVQCVTYDEMGADLIAYLDSASQTPRRSPSTPRSRRHNNRKKRI